MKLSEKLKEKLEKAGSKEEAKKILEEAGFIPDDEELEKQEYFELSEEESKAVSGGRGRNFPDDYTYQTGGISQGTGKDNPTYSGHFIIVTNTANDEFSGFERTKNINQKPSYNKEY